jgi:hypothetical protein
METRLSEGRENEKGERTAHLRKRTWCVRRDEIFGCFLLVPERHEDGFKTVVELLKGFVCLSCRLEELGGLEEGEVGTAIPSLKDGAVGGLEVAGFASDLGRLKPKFSHFASSDGVQSRAENEKESSIFEGRKEGGKESNARET